MEELLAIIPQLDAEGQAKLLAAAKEILQGQFIDNEPDERLGQPLSSVYYDANQSSFSAQDIEAIVKRFPLDKKWTFEDLGNESIFPPEIFVKIEIHNYQLFIMADPTLTHQLILTNIATFINYFVLNHKLGQVYVAPVSVKFSEGNVYKPDILFISWQKITDYSNLIDEKSINLAPELVIEVISKSNYKKLREGKKAMYAQNKVQEYWEIWPSKKSIRIETLQNGAFTLFSEATQNGIVKSSVLAGFEMDLGNIFS